MGVKYTAPDKTPFAARAAALMAELASDRPLSDLVQRVAAS